MTGGAFVVGDSAAALFRQMTRNETQTGKGLMGLVVQHTSHENCAHRKSVGHTTSVKDDRSDQEGAVPLEQRDRRRLEGGQGTGPRLENARSLHRVEQKGRRLTCDLKEITDRIRGRRGRNLRQRLRRAGRATRRVAVHTSALRARRSGGWAGSGGRHALPHEEQGGQHNRRGGLHRHALQYRREGT